MSGTWVTGRAATATPGLLIYIMVDSVAVTIDTITAHGGEIVQPMGADATEIIARFRESRGKRDRSLSATEQLALPVCSCAPAWRNRRSRR